jgi:hypothetical protein
MHQVGYAGGIKTKPLLRDGGNEAGAGFEIGIVKFAITLILFKVARVGRRQERALVMIEPPGDFGGGGIFEIDDGVFVAIKLLLVKQRPGAMKQSGEDESGVAANALPIEAGKQGRRASPIKAFVVIENPNFQSPSFKTPWAAELLKKRGPERKNEPASPRMTRRRPVIRQGPTKIAAESPD